MTKILPSTLQGATTKVIKPYECSFIATEGPNIMGKVNMAGLEIPYDSFFTSKMELTTDVEAPIMYGFLGNNVTFIMIKVTYVANNPQCCDETDNFIQYWFTDAPSTVRNIGQLMILTGNSDHKIPQIYLKNTTDNTVYVEIMVADYETAATAIDTTTYSTFSNLYWNSIITDQIFTLTTGGTWNTGSTELIILDDAGEYQSIIKYSKITNIEKVDTTKLSLFTSTDNIILDFVSEFHSYQALSRMSWAQEGQIGSITQSERFMTVDVPGIDTAPPIITLYSGATSTGMTLSGVTSITDEDLRDYWVESVWDYDDDSDLRDGQIDVANVEVTIRLDGSLIPLSAITADGDYTITFSVKDLADNLAYEEVDLKVDDEGPVITWKTTSSTGITFCDIASPLCETPSPITKYWLINTHYINSVDDNVDGNILKSSVDVDIFDNTTGITTITEVGDYELLFKVSDSSGNLTTSGFTASVREDLLPDIIYNDAYTGSTFSIHSGYTQSETGFTSEVISSITDTYETLTYLDVYLTDISDVALTYPLSSGYVKVNVTNLSGLSDSDTKTITI